jgi:hypothetical protein
MQAASSTIGNSGSLPFSIINVVYIVTGFIGIACNLFAIIILVLHDPLRKRLSNYFFVNQCALDLVVGALQIVVSVLTSFHTDGALLYVWCYVINSKVLFTGLLMASTWNLVAMSVERYLEIVHPIVHKMRLNRRRIVATTASVWVFGILFKCVVVLPLMRVTNGMCLSGQYPNAGSAEVGKLYNVAIEFVFPVGIITACYMKMVRATRRVNFSAAGPQMARARRNILQILTIFVVCFMLSAGPKQILLVLNVAGAIQVDFTGPAYTACLFLNYIICCINPFIFLSKYEDFQKGTKAVMCRRLPRVASTSGIGTNRITTLAGSLNVQSVANHRQNVVFETTDHH